MGTLNARSTRDTLCGMSLSPTPVRPRFRGASLVLACALAPSLSCGGGGGVSFPNLLADPASGPPAGTEDAACPVPADGAPLDVSAPRTVVGTGTPGSCTSQAFVDAVAAGGVITFDCGPDPVTITLEETAKVFNDTGPEIVIDGGGLVTLSGGGQRRILYMNTCDQAQVWTTSHCNDQDHPRLSIQNITFVDGDASGEDPDGGGAIFVRGGRLRVVNSRFFRNACDAVGQDNAGGAIRAFDQYRDEPIYIVNSTFGGASDLGNHCSNGGALGSIGVSFTVINSVFTHNEATGNGANPMRPGTPGGGNGGAIANDGNRFTLSLCGSELHDNVANEGGGGIFFVSNNRTGAMRIRRSTLCDNESLGFETNGYPGIFVLASGDPSVSGSTLSETCAAP